MILTIDTSTNIASVSLTDSSDILYSYSINDGKTHSQKLMPMIDECFTKTSLSPSDMDAFAVVSGPGSFTGLRIGIAAIQGFAYSASKPCVSVTSLDAMAYGADSYNGLIVPLIDARNSQAYSACYDASSSLEKIIADNAGPVESIVKEVSSYGRNVLFLGDGAYKNKEIILDVLGTRAIFLDEDKSYVAIKGAAILAQKYFDENKTVNPRDLLPYYFRDTSAKKKFQ